ncbi:MAG TPA: hypothetical protein PKA28_16555 [Methylomusa anaerophila]|uniref:Cyclic lactone autoinducer peptide n=1 Tax=Methylomusa anaerophila TaxID=1930071 RepID=A0A348AQT1_9FIRM|nr:hypothetical protein [Methylomusa anaerophila]BBB93429.1 hypothetical protein MAMMFC1_04146 [Methylomusa anaerophila]HML90053.1 hypothetical protein [Methylomusa anaerophila]
MNFKRNLLQWVTKCMLSLAAFFILPASFAAYQPRVPEHLQDRE